MIISLSVPFGNTAHLVLILYNAQQKTSYIYFYFKTYFIVANASPNITVDKIFNVTGGQQNILTVTTFDQDGDTVTVTLDSTLPVGATFVDSIYTWTPSNMEPVNISCVLHTTCYMCTYYILHKVWVFLSIVNNYSNHSQVAVVFNIIIRCCKDIMSTLANR